ncbi:glycosyl transferase, group 1 family protein [Mariniradius saccharolyticus AK6]|uniref:Glycosyl transferase, group 1 family protein n=1 Tax=Mariniradius saccharolyticus AK6 TaxID=1239962 RepID=M7Y4X7_9BACT|nr:glycosyltransferase [Mariniradius saccharolyticus]EMS32301.1 glycosyl transferase, group 1 family protein [Mariniradius saccharolyticus AK6]
MKIRVLHCIETIASGGVEQTRLTLIRGLDKQRFEHKIICTWAGGPVAEALKNEGVELIVVGPFKHPFEIQKHRKVFQVIRSFSPHIIHGAIFEGMAMAAIGGVCGRVPVVILEETSEPVTRSMTAIWIQRLFVSLSDKIIGISPAVVKYLTEKAKLPLNKILLVNNGVQMPNNIETATVEKIRVDLGIADGDFVIGSVGRIYNDVKRFSDVLEAIKILDRKDLKFLLVGDGPDLLELRNKAIALGLERNFISVGYQENPSLFYRIMDIFCLPSAHEGFGLVAAEAMLHRLPVIASNVGGLADVVVDGITGFIIPPYSPEAISTKILMLEGDAKMRTEMGDRGWARAKKNYTSERYCKEIENLYLKLVSKKTLTRC